MIVMRGAIGVFATLAWLALPPRLATAVVVLERNSREPLMGYLVRESEQAVVIRQESAGGQWRELVIPRGRIDELIVTVSADRLAALDPARPELYREYAEELAEKQRDPEARDAARRLFAIAAHRGDATLRHSALLGLIALAPTADEQRRLRGIAYLQDPAHDEALLVPTSSAGRSASDKLAEQLRMALRLLRQGKAAAARPIVEQPSTEQWLLANASVVSAADVSKWLSSPALTDEQLARLLRAELALELLTSGPGTEAAATGRFPTDSRSAAPMPLLRLEQLTEFDPAHCVFRNGRWVSP